MKRQQKTKQTDTDTQRWKEIRRQRQTDNIEYKGKSTVQDILHDRAYTEYIPIFNGSHNILTFGDNYDVLKYLMYQRKLQGKVKLIYIDPPYGTNSVFHSRENKKDSTSTKW